MNCFINNFINLQRIKKSINVERRTSGNYVKYTSNELVKRVLINETPTLTLILTLTLTITLTLYTRYLDIRWSLYHVYLAFGGRAQIVVYNVYQTIPYLRAPRLAYRPSASREQRYLAKYPNLNPNLCMQDTFARATHSA